MSLAAGVQLPADELFGTCNFIFFMIIFAVIKFVEQYGVPVITLSHPLLAHSPLMACRCPLQNCDKVWILSRPTELISGF